MNIPFPLLSTTAHGRAIADVLESFLECLSDIFVLKGFLSNPDFFKDFLIFRRAYLSWNRRGPSLHG